MGEVEVFLPNMRGNCVTVGTRVHGLFLPNWRKPQTEAPHAGAHDDHTHPAANGSEAPSTPSSVAAALPR